MAITEIGQVPADYETFDVIPDSIYGSGMDGNVSITSNTALTRDMPVSYTHLRAHET